MNVYANDLKRLRDGIRSALPGVIVNDSLIDHAQFRRGELLNGAVTVLLERIDTSDDWYSTMKVLITGQMEVKSAEKKEETGALVEAAELALFSKLRRYLRNTGGLPAVKLKEVVFSAQSKVPFGWFLLRAQYGPINEACTDWDFGDLPAPPNMYPPSVLITPLGGVDIKVDIEPHESAAVHQKWLLGEPTAEKPDMIFTVELNNGN